MNETGIKILNMKAGTLYGYNLGIRDRYDYTTGVFNHSLFRIFLQKNGMKVTKGQSTKDIICLDFDFGSRSYEEERKHLTDLLNKADDEATRENIRRIMEKVEQNKYKYVKKSKEEIRELFYQEGVSVTYLTKDRQGNIIKEETIHYRMLYRNSSKAKLGQVMFLNEKLYDAAYDWLTMGLGEKMPVENAKIVELSAYAPLTTSTILDTLFIPAEDILILKDQDSFFTTMANVVKAEDYEGFERCVDEAATEKARQRALTWICREIPYTIRYSKKSLPSKRNVSSPVSKQMSKIPCGTAWGLWKPPVFRNGSTVWRCFGIIFLKPVPLNAPFKNLCRTGAGITVSIIIPGAYRICSANGTMQRTSSLLPLTMPSNGSNSWI